MAPGIELKELIYDACLKVVNERLQYSRMAMDDAQVAANEEEKSSAGDKYETGRAMAQIERDKAAIQVAEALKMHDALKKIDPIRMHQKIEWGSLIQTDRGWYFLAVALGRIQAAEMDCMAISPVSPLGKLLVGKIKGERIVVNGQPIFISAVY
ncbi:MAG: 3-oxoacyl-ACP synthase [Flammeovirgaceae bacterium]